MLTYSEVIMIPSFTDRYRYLRLGGKIGDDTFGYSRFLNQKLYNTPEWRRARRNAILRDNGCDLAHEDYSITGQIFVHHINPLTPEMILERDEQIFDLENLITVSKNTHMAIHYGDESLLPKLDPLPRFAGDTTLW